MPMWEIDSGVIVPECTGLWWKSTPLDLVKTHYIA